MRSRGKACVLLVGAAAVAACFPSFDHLDDGADAPGTDASGLDGTSNEGAPSGDAQPMGTDGGDAAPALPVSCTDARDRGFRVTDGDVTIDPDGAAALRPFVVFCKDMSTSPREFLTLLNTTDPNSGGAFTSGTNVSGWAMGPGSGALSCLCPPDVVRAFTKVRLKLGASAVKVDVTDTTFSSTNRMGDQPNACEKASPSSCQAFSPAGSRFGTAACCIEGAGALGRANVDLRGTVFSIAATETGRTEGFAAMGNTTYMTDSNGRRKQAEIHGGGACGFQLAGKSGSEIVLAQDAP